MTMDGQVWEQVLRFWAASNDIMQIARPLGLDEADVYNFLARRNGRRTKPATKARAA
jgi:hypothetical protein